MHIHHQGGNNFYGGNTHSSGLSSSAKPAPGGVYSAPTPPSTHSGAGAGGSGSGHGSSSHGSPGTTATASKPLYGGQQAGSSSGAAGGGGGGVSGSAGPGGMGAMQQGQQGQQAPQVRVDSAQRVGGGGGELVFFRLCFVSIVWTRSVAALSASGVDLRQVGGD